MPMNARKFRGAVIDSPDEAQTYETKLRDGDLVVAYVQRLFHLRPLNLLISPCLRLMAYRITYFPLRS